MKSFSLKIPNYTLWSIWYEWRSSVHLLDTQNLTSPVPPCDLSNRTRKKYANTWSIPKSDPEPAHSNEIPKCNVFRKQNDKTLYQCAHKREKIAEVWIPMISDEWMSWYYGMIIHCLNSKWSFHAKKKRINCITSKQRAHFTRIHSWKWKINCVEWTLNTLGRRHTGIKIQILLWLVFQ